MTSLNTFINRIRGTYSNEAQECNAQLPRATHIVTPCNEWIVNLPKDYDGIFVIDETYYKYDNYKMELHHLYCYQELQDGTIQLTSYNLPDSINEQEFRNDTIQVIDFTKLKVKQDFDPIQYVFKDNIYHSEGSNEIAPNLLLHVDMKIHDDYYTIVEACYQNDKLVSGFEEPVIYRNKLVNI